MKFLNFKFQILRVFVFVLFIFGFIWNNNVFAADFRADYQVEYDLSNFKDTLTSRVKFNIKITNLKSDVYVNKFAISFPKSFTISNLASSDDRSAIEPKIISDEYNTKVEMEFSNPNIGKDSVNNFYLNFDQSNLFQLNGSVWEVVLPVIENREGGDYQVIVSLPLETDKKISISKPKPNQIDGNKIIWSNPKEKTIYAVFGEIQTYKAELTYHLRNTEVYPISTEISFPPDTLYQKIFIESISTLPDSAYRDEDGNFLAKYLLKPLETKTIIFNSYIQIFSSPREEMKKIIRHDIESQKKYLLTSQKYWTINSLEKIDGVGKEIKEIYDFVERSLEYNYNKINSDNLRLGAQGVLNRPTQAVCMEFTDLFIGISREKGIMAREIQGYGVSFDPRLQPLSLASDVLHAWPEYYDEKTGLWIPVDPTWENTSGIDYFSSFDLNHIVFAIHGKKSDYPLPAGMYKIDDSKDISIKATIESPKEKKSIDIKNLKLEKRIFENNVNYGKFQIQNTGNVYLFDIPIYIYGKNIKVNKDRFEIETLAPYESKEIVFEYQGKKNNQESKISVEVFDQVMIDEAVNIITPYYFMILILGGGVVLILVLFKVFRRSKRKK